MTNLKPAKHPLPDEALDGDIVILARKEAGKTVLTKVLVEDLLSQGERVIIIDPLSVHWGLKSSADGKSEGFPVAIFGGPRADVPLSLSASVPVAKTLVENNLPAIIDVSEWLEEEQGAFLIPFLSEIYQNNTAPLWIVLEEAHEFCPQTANSREQHALLNMIRRISKSGRTKGIRLIAVTQRTSELHKSIISGASTMIALKTTLGLDQDPIVRWFQNNAGKEFSAIVKKGLGRLPVKSGAAFIGASNQDLFARVDFPLNVTFDSSATPKRGETRIEPTRLSKIDLSGIKKALAADKEEEKAEEAAKEAECRSPALDAALLAKSKEEGRAEAMKGVQAAIELSHEQGFALGWEEAFKSIDSVRRLPDGVFRQSGEAQSIKIDTIYHKPTIAREPKSLPPEAERLTGPQTRVLEGLAFWANLGFSTPNRTQVAFVARYSVKSSSFEKAYGSLRTAGWVSYPSGKSLKAERDVSSFCPQFVSVPALISRLTGPQRRALVPMLSGGSMDRADIAEKAEYSPKSSSFEKALGSLRSLGLIEYGPQQTAYALDWLVQLNRLST